MITFYNIGNQYSDVLVVDENGSEHIKRCIPRELSIKVLKVRNMVPYVYSFSFFIYLIKRVLQFGVNRRSLFIAIVDYIDPRVLITFTDNSPIISMMSKVFPQKLVISIQNGIRTGHDINLASNFGNYSLPHYFAFGKYEYDLMIKNNIEFNDYYSSGSLKMDIFLSERYKDLAQQCNSRSVCFISQYIHSYASSNDKSLNEFVALQKELFSYVTLFCRNNNYELKVILRHNSENNNYENEVSFFNSRKFLDKITLCENNSDNFSAYRDSFESSVIVALDSTLALELFSQGKKVLFCPVYKVKSLRNVEFRDYLSNLPEINVLKEMNISKFNKIFFNLLDMDDNEYSLHTKDARGDYINYERPYVHDIVSEFISRKINV
jgi:surface carbohydrate biosynthesis protein